MAKKAIAKTTPQNEQMPAFMQGQDTGTETLGQYVVPPRIKVVQKQSGEQFEEYPAGTVLLMPQKVILAGPGEPFHFVPLFFFPEWCVWNPLQISSLPMIRERTLDPTHEMVERCRDPERWEMPCPEDAKYMLRYVEHLNFVIMPVGNPEVEDTMVNLSFSKSNHKSGTTLAGLIKMRRAPICGCQFEARTVQRSNASGSWWGIEVGQPSTESEVTPFVEDQQRFELYQELHGELKEHHAQTVLRVDYTDDTIEPQDDEPTEY